MNPQLIYSPKEMSATLNELRGIIGFVPTMGYLHEGHLSLVREAKKKSDIVVVSIYVNPTQFGVNEDLSSYPRDIERDIELLSKLNVNYIFFPTDKQMYPEGYKTWINVDKITQVLCGRSRPKHFQGVTTIVAKLINIINPDFMFMGEKDYQQLIVLKQMVNDLNFRVKVVGCPIVRESDGLALSSRNKYLSESGRLKAACLNSSLQKAQLLFNQGIRDTGKIISEMSCIIKQNDGIIDYIEVIDPNTLEHVSNLTSGCRIALAVLIENTRLIDNTEIV